MPWGRASVGALGSVVSSGDALTVRRPTFTLRAAQILPNHTVSLS